MSFENPIFETTNFVYMYCRNHYFSLCKNQCHSKDSVNSRTILDAFEILYPFIARHFIDVHGEGIKNLLFPKSLESLPLKPKLCLNFNLVLNPWLCKGRFLEKIFKTISSKIYPYPAIFLVNIQSPRPFLLTIYETRVHFRITRFFRWPIYWPILK